MMSDKPLSEFEKAAANQEQPGIVSDFWHFLLNNKKWWLLPILIMLLMFGVLMLFYGTAAMPFIYTLF
jgi:hypothetical protein